MKVVHVITGMLEGGAQVMLLKLISSLDRQRYEPTIVTLLPGGFHVEALRSLRIPLHCLGMRRGIPDPRGVWTLARLLRRVRPDVVQTWLYHADLVGGLAAKLAGGTPVVWNIQNSTLEPGRSKLTTILTRTLCARLSRKLPARIVCCSEVAGAHHVGLGYDPGKFLFIPNGFDLDAFRPEAAMRRAVRQELNIPDTALLIGLVGRFDPQKDHQTFLKAAALLALSIPEVHFLLCGLNVDWENPRLTSWVENAGIRRHCHLLGRRSDMPAIQASLDIATLSSSYGEASPNAIGEAMAAGVPCVVTDVGDSAWIVGETGRIVPPRDPEALARAWMSLLELPTEARAALGAAARDRIKNHFSLPVVVARYAELYNDIVGVSAGSSSLPNASILVSCPRQPDPPHEGHCETRRD
jgi:glycosyltransferase involved in cell wall biosynthesis